MSKFNETKAGTTEQNKQAVIEGLWLNYYNDTLLARGLITQEQYDAMCSRIKRRAPSSAKERQRPSRFGYTHNILIFDAP